MLDSCNSVWYFIALLTVTPLKWLCPKRITVKNKANLQVIKIKITTTQDLQAFLMAFKESMEHNFVSMETRIVNTKESMEEKLQETNLKIDGCLNVIDEEVKKINVRFDVNEEKYYEANKIMDSQKRWKDQHWLGK